MAGVYVDLSVKENDLREAESFCTVLVGTNSVVLTLPPDIAVLEVAVAVAAICRGANRKLTGFHLRRRCIILMFEAEAKEETVNTTLDQLTYRDKFYMLDIKWVIGRECMGGRECLIALSGTDEWVVVNDRNTYDPKQPVKKIVRKAT